MPQKGINPETPIKTYQIDCPEVEIKFRPNLNKNPTLI